MDTAEASAPSRFVGNAAVSGGAIAASDIGTLQFSSDDKKAKAHGDLPLTYMFNNTALSGGAVAVSRGSFYGTMSGIFIVLVHFDSNTAVPNQAAAAGLLQMLSLDWDSASSIASTVGCGPGGGGALCLVATQHSDLAVLGNCTFVNNLAAYGGGVYVTNNAELCGSNPDRCGRFTVLMTGSFQKWPSDISGAFKTSYVSSNNMCRFRNNTAVGGAGSAIYSDLPAGVTINCGPETPGGVPSVKPCPSWEGSVVSSRPPPAQPNPGNVTNTPLPAPSSGGVGNSSSSSRDGTSAVDDAGKATGLLLGGGADMVATSGLNLSVRPTTISQFTPDTDIVLWVASYDAFGHNLAYQYPSGSGSDNLTCEASTDSTNNAILYGQTSTEVTLTAATASQPAFTSLKLRLLPGSQQNVTITCTISQRQRVLPPATVMVSARSCLINEIISDTKDACMQCDSGFVALTPNTSCQACPASSTCNSLSVMGAAEAALLPGRLAATVGPGIIVPNPGSWHSSPFATELYDCPNPASCSRDGRTHMLTAYQAQLVQNPRQYNATLWNSLMCADGYTGNFCGSCAPGYGSVAPARCVKCAGRGLGTLYYLLTTLLTLVPLLITLRASLKESQLILAEVDDEDLDSDVDEEIEFRSREFIAAQVIAEQDAQLAQSANHDDVRLEGLQCSTPVYLQHTNPLAAFPPNDDIKVDDARVGCGPSTLADPGDSCRHSSASGSPGPGLAITPPSRLLSGTIPSPSSPTLSHHTAMTVVPQNASHPKPPCQVQPSPLWASAGAETEHITMEPATAALPPSLHLQLPHRQPPSTQLPGLQLGDRVVSADVGLARQAAPEQVGPVRALSSRQPNQSAWPTHRGGVNELSEVACMVRYAPLKLPKPIETIINIAMTLSTVPGSAVSMDCSLADGSGVTKAVQRTLVGVFSPWLSLAAVLMMFVVMHHGAASLRRLFPQRFQQEQEEEEDSDRPSGLPPLKDEGSGDKSAARRAALVLLAAQQKEMSASLWLRLVIASNTSVFVFFPSAVTTLFNIFSCVNGDGEDDSRLVAALALPPGTRLNLQGTWWQLDMEQRCFMGMHYKLALGLGVPGLLLIALGIPVVSAWFLALNRHRLYTDKQLKACWMFLYADYIPSCFYWESIVMFRKVAISSAMVFLAVSDVGVQVSTGAIIVLLFLALQLAAEPYSNRLLNRLEMSSQGVVLTNLLLSLYLTYPATQQDQVTSMTLSMLILILNVLLVLLFIAYLFRAVHDLLLYQVGIGPEAALSMNRKELSKSLSKTYGRFAPLISWPLRWTLQLKQLLAPLLKAMATMLESAGRKVQLHLAL
ncbi:hypothetical protein V8C86DRAFT_1057288 [Haematococcus lacustris]